MINKNAISFRVFSGLNKSMKKLVQTWVLADLAEIINAWQNSVNTLPSQKPLFLLVQISQTTFDKTLWTRFLSLPFFSGLVWHSHTHQKVNIDSWFVGWRAREIPFRQTPGKLWDQHNPRPNIDLGAEPTFRAIRAGAHSLAIYWGHLVDVGGILFTPGLTDVVWGTMVLFCSHQFC